jgi:hypothetical protein
MTKLLIYFLIFISLRFILWGIFGTNMNPEYIIDGREYKYMAETLQPAPKEMTGYELNNWYERTPLYVLFLHIIGNQIWIQILVTGIAGVYAFKLNKYMGWYFLLYPDWVFQSFNYSKEALLVSLMIVSLYYLKDKPRYLFTLVVIINIGFLGYAQSLLQFNLSHSVKPMQAIWEIWKPSQDAYISATLGGSVALILILPFYLIKMYYFTYLNKFKLIKDLDISLLFVIGITLFFMFGWANCRYTEIPLPFMVYYIFKNERN